MLHGSPGPAPSGRLTWGQALDCGGLAMPFKASADRRHHTFKAILGNCQAVVQGLGTIRNKLGDRRWCTEVGEPRALAPSGPRQATRTEIGLAARIMRLSTPTAMAASPCCAGEPRARSFEPMIAW